MSEQLTAESVSQALASSLALVEKADSFQDLKAVKAAAVGEESPLSKLNALIKSLPGDQKAEAGKLIGAARAELNVAFTSKETELQAIADAQALEQERVDITAVPSRTP